MSDPMNTATYQCRLRVSRCTTFDENNDVSDRCEIESPFMGPVTSLNVLGMYTAFFANLAKIKILQVCACSVVHCRN